jgi:hypothetical protein
LTLVLQRLNVEGMRLTLLAISLLLVVVGCDGSSKDKTTEFCERFWDVGCAKLVECRVQLPSGGVITAAGCEQGRAGGVSDCVMESSTSVPAASDSQIDACIMGFATFACANLCNQVPMDPAACQVIDPEPSMEFVTCAP